MFLFDKDLFSEHIQAEIARRNMSVPEFAKMLGVSKDTVYNWIKKRNGIQRATLMDVARILEVDPWWLIGAPNTSRSGTFKALSNDPASPSETADASDPTSYSLEKPVSAACHEYTAYKAPVQIQSLYDKAPDKLQNLAVTILTLTQEDIAN